MQKGDRLRHYKGKFYKVLGIGLFSVLESKVVLEDEYLLCHATMEENGKTVMVFAVDNVEDDEKTILMCYTDEETPYDILGDTFVVYEHEETGNKWVRPLDEMDEIVNREVGTKRFTKVD